MVQPATDLLLARTLARPRELCKTVDRIYKNWLFSLKAVLQV